MPDILQEPEPARGQLLPRTLSGAEKQRYFLYVPNARIDGGKVLVLIHGISRNAQEHAEVFQSYAEQYGAILVAPVFGEDNFRGYQRLGLSHRTGHAQRPDIWLRRILDDVTRLTGVSTARFYLFGHSGGGQFAHRYAMAYPDTVIRYAISASGWYTMPNLAAKYPYGMKRNPKLPDLVPNIERFLRIPACVLVGADDTERDETLNRSERIDSTQGRSRVERAEHWVAAMTTAARWRGLDTSFRLHVIPHAGHDFTELANQGRIGAVASRCLFE